MINIREAVESILTSDYVALESLKRRVMNLSEYARDIKEKVSAYTKKDVGIQSIVVTLARLEQKFARGVYKNTDVAVAQLAVQSPIVQLVYPKTRETLQALTNAIRETNKLEDAFFSFSTSTKDIALIVSEKLETFVLEAFQHPPILKKRGLSAISIRFDEKLVEEANVGLVLLQKIASRNIVLDAALTTYNEFTLIFESKYLHDAIEALQPK